MPNISMTEKFEESLSHRVVKSGFWVLALRITNRFFYLTRLIILARILSPHDFGLLGIAMLAMLTLENFSQTGFQAALIQKKENTEKYLNSAWTIGILRGVVLFSILYFIAPHVASFFNVPPAKPIIQVISFSILLQAFANIGVVYFQKELQFNKQFIYQLSGTLVDFIVAVCAAFILRNVWALVFGLLAGNFVRLIMSYIIHPYRPHIELDFGKAKELFGFGKWVLGSSILMFLTTQGDDAFVGKFLGATMLGFYQMAYRISNMPATEITHVISQVMFPAYSRIQHDISKLREVYLKILQVTAFLSFPVAGLIFVLGSDFTRIFLGEKWIPMVPAMQMLVFAGLVRSIAAIAGPVFYAVGKPKIDTKLQVIRLFVLAVLIYPFTLKWGIFGSSLAVFFSIFFANIGFSFFAMKITKCELKTFAIRITFPLLSGTVAVLPLLFFKKTMPIGIAQLITLAFTGILTYLSMVLLSDKFFNYQMQPLLKDIIRSFRKA